MTETKVNPDYFRNLLAFVLVGAFIAMIPLLIFKNIPGDNKEIIVYMVGQLSGMALTALGFYFVNKAGQDALDTKRAETTGKMAEAITAAANATPPTAEPQPVVVTNTEAEPVPTTTDDSK